VNCSSKDGFPAEASELVRCFAYVALERCLRKCVEAEPESPPEPPPAAKKAMFETLTPLGGIPDYTAAILLAAYYSPETSEPASRVFANARLTLARGIELSPRTLARLSGPRSVHSAFFPDETHPATLTAAVSSGGEMDQTQRYPGPIHSENALAGDTSLPTERKHKTSVLGMVQDAFRR
jgi:hypothetical protein